jgi:branched-chain amino acid transport system ATP-binding protein
MPTSAAIHATIQNNTRRTLDFILQIPSQPRSAAIVARALMAQPEVLLLDEVTEGLQPSLVDRLSDVLTRLRQDIGTSMIVIEQHLPFALGIASRYLVFKRGEIVDSARVDAEAAARIEAHMRI